MEIALKNKLLINGQELGKLELDFENLTCLDFCKASAAAGKKTGADDMQLAEFNSALHLYLAFFAAMKANNKIGLLDLEKQIKGADCVSLMREGRNFFISTLAD